MNQFYSSLLPWAVVILMGNTSLNSQTPLNNIHHVVINIKMSLDSNDNPISYDFYSAASTYAKAPEKKTTISEPGYVLEYITVSGEKICSSFQLAEYSETGGISDYCSADVPTDKNGLGYRIYKNGILIWTEKVHSPNRNLPICVENLGSGRLHIKPNSVNSFYLSLDGGLHWKAVYKANYMPDEPNAEWVYQIPKYDSLKVPKPLVRIDKWHKLRRQQFTYEVRAPVALKLKRQHKEH